MRLYVSTPPIILAVQAINPSLTHPLPPLVN